jgi:hypothetical protein
MSTRCQIQVFEYDGRENPLNTLYHHLDGYPEYMIPKIFEAYSYGDQDPKNYREYNFLKSRAGKIAGLLCWADPGCFEPEDRHNFHSDIDYYYRLYFREFPKDEQKPLWEIEIFKRTWNDFDHSWSIDQIKKYFNSRTEKMLTGLTIEDFSLIQKRVPIEELVQKYI